ncbi:MAG TPA: penicillin-binding protein activator LpoB [Elusimicrobiota bacterium]|nr:penicillin-binding protein activator LpoB [Elusimicrobiota bacterium]
MKKALAFSALAVAVGFAGCSSISVKRESANQVQDLSGRWNEQDSLQVAHTMISDCLSRAWLDNWDAGHSKPPVVIVGDVRNMGFEHIDTDSFIEDLQSELINSGKVQFVAGAQARQGVRAERLDQDANASADTRKANGQETGADFMLQGIINEMKDTVGGRSVVTFQTNLKLVNLETNVIVWNGEDKINKYIKRSALGF